jgi:hypothetical protein
MPLAADRDAPFACLRPPPWFGLMAMSEPSGYDCATRRNSVKASP